jgi:hypothetical protein
MRSDKQRVKTHVVEQLAPCEKGCWFWYGCSTKYLACKQFEEYVRYGVDRLPPKNPPTRAMFDRIFRELRVGRPSSHPKTKRCN